jgi:hypothetical protein
MMAMQQVHIPLPNQAFGDVKDSLMRVLMQQLRALFSNQSGHLLSAVASHVGQHTVELAGLQMSLKAFNQFMHNLQQAWPLFECSPVCNKCTLTPKDVPAL